MRRKSKSTEEKLAWHKAGQPDLFWKLEGDINEGIDPNNVVLGKRKVSGAAGPVSRNTNLSRADLFKLTTKLQAEEGKFLDAQEATKVLATLSEHKMTMEDLRLTKIGKEVNRYRGHSDSKVAVLAKTLLKKYKSLADAAKG
eukprot:g5001.t1